MQDMNKCLSIPDSEAMRNAKLDFVFICCRGSCSLHETSSSESVQKVNLMGNQTTKVTCC